MKINLLRNSTASRAFWILLLGMFLIIAASISLSSLYIFYGRAHFTTRKMANEFIEIVLTAKTTSISRLPKLIKSLGHQHVKAYMAMRPNPKAQIIQLTNPPALREFVKAHPKHFWVSIEMANGQWLNVHAHRGEKKAWFLLAIGISGLVLFLALLALCYQTIKEIALPMNKLAEAAERFGVDIQAPPLAVSGPKEMQKAINAFNEMQSRIKRLIHDRTQMLAAISHDLRTPITRLQLRAEYLQGTDQYEKALGDLSEMEGMIESILAFARDHVRTEQSQRFDLNALLETACDEQVDVGKQVIYKSELKRQAYFGRIASLKRAFNNLIENAVKYGDKATVELKASLEEIQIKITDHGPGIPEDQFEKVFAPFYRVDPSRNPGKSGTGLGMAVARDIIRAHGGDITLANADQGLVVLVKLPV